MGGTSYSDWLAGIVTSQVQVTPLSTYNLWIRRTPSRPNLNTTLVRWIVGYYNERDLPVRLHSLKMKDYRLLSSNLYFFTIIYLLKKFP